MNSSTLSLAARWSDPSAPSPPSASSPGSSSGQESWAERVYAALPLFLVGGVCVGLALQLHATGAGASLGGSGSVALRPWVLFVALGITGLCAGAVALFAQDLFAESHEVEEEVTSPRSPPDWDESLLEPEPRTIRRRRTWEMNPYSLEGVVAEASPSEGALDQLDEIEAALRKKPGISPPE